MIFSSPAFILFFIVFYLIHLASPKSMRLSVIIVGSTIFYSFWNVMYVWIPHFLALTTFFGAKWLEKAELDYQRNWRFAAIIVLLTFPLIFFKYTNFIFQSILNIHEKPLNLLLPLGISFVTFSLIAYVAEVYKKKYPAEKRISNVLGYTLFFPHLIAGPILKPWELIPQFSELSKPFNVKRLTYGATLFSIGMMKKLVFADPLGVLVKSIYASPEHLSSFQYLLAVYAFPVQIYCDFSGYTDMAMGIAYILGVRLPNNFAQPFTSKSIIEFWRRWHISLSTWLKDYIYIPLGGNKNGLAKQGFNLLITMVVSGIWHGASWGFVAWGGSHGLFIVLNHNMRKLERYRFYHKLPTLPPYIKVMVVFNLVALMWVFFRASNMSDAWLILTGIFTSKIKTPDSYIADNIFFLLLIGVFYTTHRWDDHRRVFWFSRKNLFKVVLPMLVFIWLLSMSVSAGSSSRFIYFDF